MAGNKGATSFAARGEGVPTKTDAIRHLYTLQSTLSSTNSLEEFIVMKNKDNASWNDKRHSYTELLSLGNELL